MSPAINTHRLHPHTHLLNAEEITLDGDMLDPNVASMTIKGRGGVQLTVELAQEVFIGRRHSVDGAQPDIDLTDDGAIEHGISRLHARLMHLEHGWCVEDLNSLNGTWVNGVRLKPYTPKILGIKNQLALGNLPINVVLPHRVYSGVTVPILACSVAPMTIVQIEDSRALQEVLKTLLREIDPHIKLRQFRFGDEGLQYIATRGSSIDLYLIDMRLPGKVSGMEVAQAIREQGYPGHIILTSSDTTPPAPMLAQLNCEFATKPLHITETIPRLLNYRLEGVETAVSAAEEIPTRKTAVESDDRPTVRFTKEQQQQLEPALATSGSGSGGISLRSITRGTLQRLIARIRKM